MLNSLKNNHEAIKKVIDLKSTKSSKRTTHRNFKKFRENTDINTFNKEEGGEQTKQNKYARLKRTLDAER